VPQSINDLLGKISSFGECVRPVLTTLVNADEEFVAIKRSQLVGGARYSQAATYICLLNGREDTLADITPSSAPDTIVASLLPRVDDRSRRGTKYTHHINILTSRSTKS